MYLDDYYCSSSLNILHSCFVAPDFTERYTSVKPYQCTSVWDIESHHIKVVDITSKETWNWFLLATSQRPIKLSVSMVKVASWFCRLSHHCVSYKLKGTISLNVFMTTIWISNYNYSHVLRKEQIFSCWWTA
jgi:hypothetical protein